MTMPAPRDTKQPEGSPVKVTGSSASSGSFPPLLQCSKRPTRQVSYELANHAKAYLEGGQFASGYDFLHALLDAGTSVSTPSQPYTGLLAPPAYIGLASSLVVYPYLTTKASSKSALKNSDAALRYLRCVQTTINGSAYPTIRKAFTFSEDRNRRRAPGNRNMAGGVSPDPGGDIERIAGNAANEQCLWYRAEDFWHIVGWAFNCSVIHKGRWTRWELWLSTILAFLEADWDSCVRQYKSDNTGKEALLQESLIWRYIAGGSEMINRGMRRRIIKSIMATGTPDSQKDFPEVWEQETTKFKPKKDDRWAFDEMDWESRDMVNYESGEEDRDSKEEDEEMDKPQPSLVILSNETIHNIHDAIARLGGHDAINLRHRLLALLAQVAQALPTPYTSLDDFMDSTFEDFLQSPILVFEVLLSSLHMPDLLRTAFCTNLLLPLVSSAFAVSPHHKPTQEQFVKTLLPLKSATQSYVANAKVSLILEQIMLGHDDLKPTARFRKSMEDGIKARKSVGSTARGKKGNVEEEAQGEKVLETSSARLLSLLKLLELGAKRSSAKTRKLP